MAFVRDYADQMTSDMVGEGVPGPCAFPVWESYLHFRGSQAGAVSEVVLVYDGPPCASMRLPLPLRGGPAMRVAASRGAGLGVAACNL